MTVKNVQDSPHKPLDSDFPWTLEAAKFAPFGSADGLEPLRFTEAALSVFEQFSPKFDFWNNLDQ